MAIYDDRLQSHPVWASLAAAREALDATRDKLVDPEQLDEHAHIEAILNLLERRLDTLDAQLVPFGPLDSINGNLNELSASLRQFEANPGNRQILDQGDGQASGILSYLAQLPEAAVGEVENLREVGARYRRSMSAQVGQITGEVNTLRATVENVAQEAAGQRSAVESEAQRLAQVATDSQTAFEQAQTERGERFTMQVEDFASQLKAALDEATESVDTAVKGNRESVAEALNDLKEKSEAAWAEIAALQQRAETAANYLGINALAGGYHQTADLEERRAFWLRWGAISCFIGAIGASVFALVYHVVHAFTLDGFLTKAAVAIPFLVLAGYLARESSQHAERAHFNRQRQRQLESLPAYVDGLDVGRRAVLYEALAPGFFSPEVSVKPKEEVRSDPTTGAFSLLIEEAKKQAS